MTKNRISVFALRRPSGIFLLALAAALLLIPSIPIPALGGANAAYAQSAIDYDADNDRLIEIAYLEQLNAMRWDLNGDGVADTPASADAYAAAFPGADEGMGCPDNHCAGYELTRSLNFKSSSSYKSRSINADWTQGAGWIAIGVNDAFDGAFEGNGYTIANLYSDHSKINYYTAPSYAGLFGINNGAITRVGLTNVNVSVDSNGGTLVGWNMDDGSITNSHAAGKVSGNYNVGGLVGDNHGHISKSYTTGSVAGNQSVGGLVGSNLGSIVEGHTDARVSGSDSVGGLIGANNGRVSKSYATGNISGRPNSGGGLFGSNSGSIISSYAVGSVTGSQIVGGLVGGNSWNGVIVGSYATGSIAGHYGIGGLVGSNSGIIAACYAAGNLNGGDLVGGLVGDSSGSILASYSIGRVRGKGFIGGFLGSNYYGTIRDSLWDTETSTTFLGVGSDDLNEDGKIRQRDDESETRGITGYKTQRLKMPDAYTGIYIDWNKDFDNTDLDYNYQTGKDNLWDFGASTDYPLLKADFDGDGVSTWWEFGKQHDNRAVPTPMPNPTATNTAVPTSTPTHTPTFTATAPLTLTAAPTYTPTLTPIPTHTPSATNTPMPTHTPSATAAPVPTATPLPPTHTPVPTATPAPTDTPAPPARADASTAAPAPAAAPEPPTQTPAVVVVVVTATPSADAPAGGGCNSAGARLPRGATAGNLLALIAPLIGLAGISRASAWRAHRAQGGKRRRD